VAVKQSKKWNRGMDTHWSE